MKIGEEDYRGFSDVIFASPNEPDAISGEAYDLEGNLAFEVCFHADFQKTIRTFGSKEIDFDDWNKMLAYVKSELEIWDTNLRKPLSTWDPRLLANPELDYDELVKMDEGK